MIFKVSAENADKPFIGGRKAHQKAKPFWEGRRQNLRPSSCRPGVGVYQETSAGKGPLGDGSPESGTGGDLTTGEERR